jgi:hypothetical protein
MALANHLKSADGFFQSQVATAGYRRPDEEQIIIIPEAARVVDAQC